MPCSRDPGTVTNPDLNVRAKIFVMDATTAPVHVQKAKYGKAAPILTTVSTKLCTERETQQHDATPL